MNRHIRFTFATVATLLTILFMVTAQFTPHTFSANNNAPALDNSGNPYFNTGFQNHFSPDGTRVADMLATGASGNPISDPDLGAVEGIAVIAVDNSHGTWQYSTNNGTNWTGFPTQTFSATQNLGSLNAAGGFIINGVNVDDQAGWSVSNAGDVNNDGLDDIIIGANQASPNNQSYAGESYVIFGTRQGTVSTLDLSSLNGSNGFIINGIDPSDFSGHSVSGAGDVNNDGFDDVIIGAIQADPGGQSDAGEIYVLFGSGSFSATVNLNSLTGSNGFVLNGINSYEASDKAGYSVSNAGDVNNDGIDDIIIGAPFADPNDTPDAGQSYVVFGRDSAFPAGFNLSSLDGSNGFAINGIDQSDYAGFSVSGAGDVNGDNYSDLIIGAADADPGGNNQAGEAYVIFGSASFPSSLSLGSLNGSNGFVLNGTTAWDRTGWSVSSAGDVNGDGRDDVLVSAPEADSGADDTGKSYLVFGSDSFAASLNLNTLDGSNGFVLNGIDQTDFSGQSVSGVSDLNADGLDDLIVGANKADPNSNDSAGESYVIFGSNSFSATLNLNDLDGLNGYSLTGINTNDESGFSVGGGGDFDGDGQADLIIGAPHSSAGAANGGQTYVIFGRPQATTLTATPDDLIRFVPASGFTGTAGLTFRAWDTTDGHASGDTGVQIDGTGGLFAYSAAIEQATITIMSAPPDLVINKTIAPTGLVLPGQNITYTLTFSNAGAVTASNVVITDIIPVQVSNATATNSGAALTPVGSQNFTWQVGDLPVNSGGSITITGQISPGLSTDVNFTNNAAIAGTAPEAYTHNNTDSVTTNVAPPRVYFSTSSYSVDETAGSATITARLNIAPKVNVTVNYATTNANPPAKITAAAIDITAVNATAGSDYTPVSGTLTFGPGVTVQTFTVPILDDFLDEPDETIGLTLSNPNGAVLSTPNQATLTIINNDETITGLQASNNGPTSLNTATIFEATTDTGNNVTFAWNFGDGATAGGATVTHTYSTTGSHTATVTATNAVNQLSTTTSVVVQENVSGLVVINNSPIRLGQPTTITATVATGTDVTYRWSFGDGQNGDGAVVNHTYSTVGNHTATVTARNSVSSKSAQTSITILDVPVAGLQASNNSPKEINQSVNLYATITAGSNVNYTWNFGDGQSGSGKNVTHSYATVGTYTATVTASNSENSMVATTVLSITDIPAAGLNVTSNSPNIFGQTTQLNVTTSAGSNLVYTWNLGDGTLPGTGSTTSAHLYNAPGNYTVIVTATNGMGSVSASTQVTILPRTCWARLNNNPTDYFYVQDAINDSTQTTDVVKVAGYCSGVFTESSYNGQNFKAAQSVLLNKTLTLRGGYTSTNWSTFNPTANPTTLDAKSQGRVIFIADNAAPTIEGLNLTGGNAAGLGGSAVADIGGGVYAQNANPIFLGNEILNNQAQQGAGMWLLASSAVISNNLFTGNTATTSDGGGLYVYQGSSTIINNTLTANDASRYGGGIYLYQGTPTVSKNLISSNNAQGGAGLYMWNSAVLLNDNTVASNSATLMGGGAYLHDSAAAFNKNIFTTNNAQLGGGLYLYRDESTLNGNSVTANSASGAGGGVFLNDSDTFLANTFIIDNSAGSHGSGLHILSSHPTVAHSTIVNNHSGDSIGVYVTSGAANSSDVQLSNTILVKHTTGIYVDSTDRATLAATLWGNNTWANDTDWSGTGTIKTGSVNIWGDPAFIDPTSGNYHINLTSAGLDKGESANVSVDVDGSHRPAGGGYELGADEIPVELNVAHFATPNPVEPGEDLTYTLMVTNVDTVAHPVTIVFSPSSHVSPNTVQSWTPTLNAFGGTWSTQLSVSANLSAVGPMVSTLQATTDENDSFTNNYAVNVENAVENLVISNDSPTIVGDITTMTATADGDNINYTWDFGDGEIAAGAVVTHIYPAAGNYTVEVNAGNGVSTVSDSMTAIVQEVIDGLGVTYHSPATKDQSTTLLAFTTKGTGITYTWDFGDGTTGNGAEVDHTYNAVGTYSPVVTAVNHVSVMTKTVTMVVQEAVNGLAANNSSPTELHQSTSFSATITAGTAVTYRWDFGDGTQSSGSNANVSHTYPAVGSYTATVTAKNNVSSKLQTTLVTITDIPINGLTAGNNGPTTAGNLTTLTAGSTAGSNITYNWNFGDGTQLTDTGPTVNHRYPAVGSYTARVTAQNSTSSKNATTVVTVIDQAISGLAFTSSSPDNLGQTTSFAASISGGSNVLYNWNFGDGTTGTGKTTYHTYTTGGTFSVSLTASNSAGSKTTTNNVAINHPPTAVLSLNTISSTIETPIIADAGGSSDADGDNLTYTFDFGEKIVGPQSNPIATHTYFTGGNHTVQVTVSDGQLSSTASQVTGLKAVPKLVISKSGPTTAYAGDNITYTLTITNMTLPPGSSPSAILQIDPDSLFFRATEGGSSPAVQAFSISNAGSGALDWLANENADWLTLSQTEGSGSASVTASADISGLAPGVYTEKIIVDAGLAQNGLQSVNAILTLYCTNRQPVDVVLALDKSGSMYGTPFDTAQQSVKNFVGQMDLTTDQVGLVSFNGMATVNHTLTQNGDAVRATVTSLAATGMTNIAEAINDAHSELLSSRHRSANTPVLVLLSDGSQTVSGDPLAEAAQAKADGIRIISIGLGWANTTVLKSIASSPNDYYYAPTPDDLANIYNMIAVDVGCPGAAAQSKAVLAFKAAEKTDPFAPVFRTMPSATTVSPEQGTAYNVVITDIIPSAATYVGGGNLNGKQVGWTIPTLPPNTTVQLQFAVTAGETVVNSIYGVSADGGFNATGSKAVTTIITPRPVPAISLEKWASTNQVVGATDVTYNYRVTNIGSATLDNIAVDDDKLGFVGGTEDLTPNETWVITKAGLIVEDTTNIATVSATSPFGPASDTASAYVEFTPDWLCGATLRSVRNGDWKDASTWEPARIPRNDDIVLVQDEHTVIVKAAARTNIKALCNYGTLRSTDKQQIHIKTKDFLFNYGTIESTDGEGGPERTCGHPANDLKLSGSPITNWGTIQGGNGGDGEKCGGRGASVMVMGRNTTNYGTICAGEGGNILGTGKGTGSHAGKGGFTTVWGNHGGPGMLYNTGLICAGDGGNGNSTATKTQRGGNGGDLRLNAEPDVILSGGRYYAGSGGNGTGGGDNGKDGRVFIEPSVISLSGPNTEVKGGDIIIFGGDDWVLDLSNMNGAAIEATGDIVLAVGSGSSVDLRNNGTGSDVLKAGGNVVVKSDTILLDDNTTVNDVVEGNATVSGSEILHDISLNVPALIEGQVGATIPVTLTVMNGGPTSDSYTLSKTDNAGWGLTGLPGKIDLNGLAAGEISLTLNIPDTVESGDLSEITLTAQSEADHSLTFSTTIEIEVTGNSSGEHKIFIPVIMR